MDKEYALCFKGDNGLEEIGISSVKHEALKHARFYLKRGVQEMVLKLYQEGDLVHQWDWDYQAHSWVQYE